jgi:filamentous hemagglutinin family protein
MFFRRLLLTTSCLTALVFASVNAYANPVGGVVAGGQANISQSGTTLDVTQTSNRAVINWQTFNIASNETTDFIQPSRSAIIVNRIGDANPSQILGRLTANGNVVLINPNGVLFGPGSVVDVNGLVATTADLDTKKFMHGGNLFFNKPGNPNASIINEGIITAQQAGLVGLVAPNVLNSGIISANLGRVQLASGDTTTVDFYGDKLLEVAVSDKVQSQLVANTGLLQAQGGTIAMTAAAGKKIVHSLIDVEGELDAPAVAQKDGEIYIYAEGSNAVKNNVTTNKGVKAGSSTVTVSGTLNASGYNPGQTGGKVSILGDNVGILSGTLIDASGDAGGGTIKIGGDFHGAGTTPTALNTYVDSNSLIMANANTSGNGGNVAVWSDGNTWFSGNIMAEGGVQSGNGGFVETSGHGYLSATGYVDLLAPNGAKGTYLLDPTDVTIYGNTASVFDNPGLVGYWNFNEGSGTTTADVSGNSNTGTLVNGPTWSSSVPSTPYLNSNSLSFNGTSQVVNAGNNATLTPTTGATFSMWVYTGGANSNYGAIITNWGGGGNSYFIGTQIGDPTTIQVYFSGINNFNITSVPLNTWTNIIVTNNGGTVTGYVNGTQSNTAAGSLVSSSGSTSIGYDVNRSNYAFIGNIDDVRVYNNVLSTNNIAELNGNLFTVAGLEDMSQTANVSVQASHNINLDFQGDTLNVASGKSLTLTAGNQITTASAGIITTNEGDINLNAAHGIIFNNAFTLNSNGGNINLNNAVTLNGNLTANAGSGTLTFGSTVDGAYNLSAAAGTFSFDGILGGMTPLAALSLTSANALALPSISAASILAQTTGASANLSISSGAVLTASGSGTAVILASGDNFINSDGSGAISLTGGGRWLIYSGTPGADTFGNLNSSNTAIWDAAYGGTISQSGDRYAFTYQPTVTFTSGNISKIYGVDGTTATAADYTVSGLQAALNNVYLVDSNATAFSGTPSVTSSGSATTATVAGSTYAVTAAVGGLTAVDGYALAYNSAGQLTITARTVTVDPTASQSKIYGVTDPTLTYTTDAATGTTGLVNSDSLTGSPSYTGAGQYTNVGAYATTLGSLMASSNYNIALEGSPPVFTINPAALTITADNESKTARNVFAFTGQEFTSAGLLNGDTVSSVTLASSAAVSTAPAGNYPITASGATGGNVSNYTITYVNGQLTVTPGPVTATIIPPTVQIASQGIVSVIPEVYNTSYAAPPSVSDDSGGNNGLTATPSISTLSAGSNSPNQPAPQGQHGQGLNDNNSLSPTARFNNSWGGLLTIDPVLARQLGYNAGTVFDAEKKI